MFLRAFVSLLVMVGLAAAVLGAMAAFGTGEAPPPLAAVASAFEKADFSDLPRHRQYLRAPADRLRSGNGMPSQRPGRTP